MKAINIIEQEQLRQALCEFKQMLSYCNGLSFDEAMELPAIKAQAKQCLSLAGLTLLHNSYAYEMLVESDIAPLGAIQQAYWPQHDNGWHALLAKIEGKYAEALQTLAGV